MNTLPNEILQNVLFNIPTKHLIFSCRLVSALWKQLATPICRNRGVSLKLHNDFPALVRIFDTFREMDQLVWSSTCFNLSDVANTEYNDNSEASSIQDEEDYSTKLTQEALDRFLDVYGPSLRRIEFGGGNDDDTQAIMGVVTKIPNVEEIEFLSNEGCSSGGLPAPELGHPLEVVSPHYFADFKLERLKRLSIFIHGEAEVNFLEFLLGNTGAKLDYICLTLISASMDTEWATKLVMLVSSVPKVVMKGLDVAGRLADGNILRALSTSRTRIPELHVVIRDYKGGSGENFRQFEQLLDNISPYLQKLVFYNVIWRMDYPSTVHPVRLPVLPVLKHIEMALDSSPEALPYLAPFYSDQFPVLENVDILRCHQMQVLCLRTSFPSVRRLSTGSCDTCSLAPAEWNRIFPYLTELELCPVDEFGLTFIFTSMTRLVHLKINIKIMVGANLGEVLTGISDPDSIYLESGEVICQYRETHPRPSLLSMTSLKTLKIRVGESGIQDSVVALSLLQMQKLDKLCIENWRSNNQISKPYAQKLRDYHNSFQLWQSSV